MPRLFKNTNWLRVLTRLGFSVILIFSLTVGLLAASTFSLPESTGNSAPSYGQLTDMKFKSVSVGEKWGMAVDAFDRAWVWGWNGRGQLGRGGANGHTAQPYAGGIQLVSGLPKVIQAAAGQSHSLAIDYSGDVWMWGYCGSSQVFPYNATLAVNTPVKLNRTDYGMGKIIKVGAGQEYSAALDEKGQILVWGQDLYGQHGDGAGAAVTPSKVIFPESNVKIVDFAAGFAHLLALDENGVLWAWGQNTYGECGIGSVLNIRNSPVKVTIPAAMGSIRQFAATSCTNMILDDKGQVWHWGQIWGVSGTGSQSVSAPTLLSFDSTKNNPDAGASYQFPGISSVHPGGMTNYLIDNHGKIWAYGTNLGYGFGTVSDYYIADQTTTAEGLTGRRGYAAEAFRTPVITGNGDQDISGGQLDRLAYFHPQVEGSQADPKRNHSGSNIYSEGYWKHFNIGIKEEFSKIIMPFAALIASYAKPDASNDQLTVVLDIDGNLWIWGYTSDGQIAWGYESVRDLDTNGFQNPATASGLWDYYMYEPVLMRGVPGGSNPSEREESAKVEFSRDYSKTYKAAGAKNSIYANVILPKPQYVTFGSINLYSTVIDIKHVLLYHQDSELYTKAPGQITAEEFLSAYNAAEAGDKGNTGVLSYTGSDEVYTQKLELAEISENCRVLLYAEIDGFYEPFSVIEAYTFDNFYTPVDLFEKGVEIDDASRVIYGPGQNKVEKLWPGEFDRINHGENEEAFEDAEKKLYGIPLYRDNNVIESPYFLFDEVKITEALPESLTGCWQLSATLPGGSPQLASIIYKLNSEYASKHPGYLSNNPETAGNANTHIFYYTKIAGDTVTVHMRYIIANAKEELPILPRGFVSLRRIQGAVRYNGGENNGEIIGDSAYGQRIIAYADGAGSGYTSFRLTRAGLYNAFTISPVIPVNYKYAATRVSQSGPEQETYSNNAFLYFKNSGGENIDELWATIIITPSAEGSPQPYSIDEIINSIGKIKYPLTK